MKNLNWGVRLPGAPWIRQWQYQYCDIHDCKRVDSPKREKQNYQTYYCLPMQEGALELQVPPVRQVIVLDPDSVNPLLHVNVTMLSTGYWPLVDDE